MLASVTEVIVSQCINVLNHTVHLKLALCSVSIKKKKNTRMNTFMLIFAHIYEYHLRIYSKTETIGRKGITYVRLLIYINRLFSRFLKNF